MTSERIKEIQATTGYPDSVSIKQALLQVWNECEQSHPSPMSASDMTARDYFDGEGSPLTLSKICSDEEKEFLLQHIELYASGKVHQSKQPPMSAEQVERVTGYDLITGALPYIEESLNRTYIDRIAKYLDSYLDKVFASPTTPSVKADRWVSVEERLPEKGERVIVCTDNWVVACCYINIHGEWKMAYDSSLLHGKITHYQPLPNPPKQQL